MNEKQSEQPNQLKQLISQLDENNNHLKNIEYQLVVILEIIKTALDNPSKKLNEIKSNVFRSSPQ